MSWKGQEREITKEHEQLSGGNGGYVYYLDFIDSLQITYVLLHILLDYPILFVYILYIIYYYISMLYIIHICMHIIY